MLIYIGDEPMSGNTSARRLFPRRLLRRRVSGRMVTAPISAAISVMVTTSINLVSEVETRRCQMDMELRTIVREDLAFLQELSAASATKESIRRASVVLRNLINHDYLRHAWRDLDLSGQPVINAPKLPESDEGVAYAGGGSTEAGSIANIRFVEGIPKDFNPDPMVRYKEAMSRLSHSFKLSEYKDAAAISVNGTRISRFQLIAYIANKRGGAHLDRNRKKDKDAYVLLDGLEGDQILGKFTPPEFELLSMGQHLTESADIQRLMELLRAE